MIYDTLILGGGPAGYSAAIYAARYNLKCLVIAKEPGGVMNEAYKVENYPGFPSIVGIELMDKIKEHVKYLGVEIKEEEILSLNNKGKVFVVKTNKNKYESRTIIIVLGAEHKKLNVSGEKELEKRGISYCYTCDGAFYKNKKVIIVGGGDAAAQAVLLLASYNNDVTLLYRSNIIAEPAYQEQFKKLRNVKLVKGEISRINGKNKVESITLKDGEEISVDGIFVEIGSEPDLSLFKNFNLELEGKYIKVDRYMKTNVNGIFAAGDITNIVFRQAITAAGDGAIAANSVYLYLKNV
ncbi:MAG: FAD-dependent oxidoreductase [Nanoarchaeota archaeon]